MSRKTKAISALIVILVLVGLGVAYRLQQNQVKATMNQQKAKADQVQTIPVDVKAVAKGNVSSTTELTGTIRPDAEVNVVPKLGGRVTRVLVDVGVTVKAGQVLAELDKSDLKAQVKQAEAALAGARARLAQVKAGARPEEVAQAEAALNQAKAAELGAKRGLDSAKRLLQERTASVQALTAAETQTQVGQAQYDSAQALVKQAAVNQKSALDNLQRMTDLYAKNAVTRVQLETAQSQADIAKAQYQSAQATLEQARVGLEGAKKNLGTTKETYENQTALQAQVDAADSQYRIAQANVKAAEARLSQVKAGARAEDIDAAAAGVQQAQAALELATSQLNSAVITAPVSGTIATRSVDPGEMAAPGVPVFTIVATGQLFVEISITEGLIDKAKSGQTVEVSVDAYPGKAFQGTLTNLAPAADSRTRAFAARVRLSDRDSLKPGMFATVKFVTDSKRGVLVIPADALVDRSGDQVVFVVEGGLAKERPVATGLTDGRTVEIVKGLAEGDQVVVAGQTQLAEGIAVKVQNEVK